MASIQDVPLVAVLYQAIDPPLIDGARKPRKPGGYQDSGADIAFVLKSRKSVGVLTPIDAPDESKDINWCFPDTEAGILDAISRGATHLWANTILFSSHPLQTSSSIGKFEKDVQVIGQPPLLVEKFDDKAYTNDLLRAKGSFTMPKGWTVELNADTRDFLSQQNLPMPIVAKPVRGRGSQGVKVCESIYDLRTHLEVLSKDSYIAMLEEYLAGEECTITVMPPAQHHPDYWAMPVVKRFDHHDGVLPYNGIVAVAANSQVLQPEEVNGDSHYRRAVEECVEVARLLCAKAPMRIDIRRFTEEADSKFALFDINMKPNITGPGRPGREDQSSLIGLAAAGLGWDYAKVLQYMLESACSLSEIRNTRPSLK